MTTTSIQDLDDDDLWDWTYSLLSGDAEHSSMEMLRQHPWFPPELAKLSPAGAQRTWLTKVQQQPGWINLFQGTTYDARYEPLHWVRHGRSMQAAARAAQQEPHQ